jgi:hypothetical protein
MIRWNIGPSARFRALLEVADNRKVKKYLQNFNHRIQEPEARWIGEEVRLQESMDQRSQCVA